MQIKAVFMELPVDIRGESRRTLFNIDTIVSIVDESDTQCRIYTSHGGTPFVVKMPYADVVNNLREVLHEI